MQAYPDSPPRLDRVETSIPLSYYYDAAHYQRELDIFWLRGWIYACRTDEVAAPGDYAVAKIGDQAVFVTRDRGGRLRAFHNTCRHRGSILCTKAQGRFKGGAIVCPYHGWTYDLEGSLVSTPHRLPVGDFDMSAYPLYDVAVDQWGGFVFVNLSVDGVVPLQSVLGDLPVRFQNYHIDELKVGHRVVREVEANWKILVENFAECLHCPNVHPELCRIVPLHARGLLYPREDPERPPTDDPTREFRLELASPEMVTYTMDGTTNRPFFRDLTDDQKGNPYQAEGMLPNFYLNVHPDYINTIRMLPKGPTRTEVTYDWLFEVSTMEREDFDVKQAYELWDITFLQDTSNCEWQQEGLLSRRHHHNVYMPQEAGVWSFNQWVLQELGEQEGPPLKGRKRWSGSVPAPTG